MSLLDVLRRAIRDQDDLDALCGPDPKLAPPPSAPPLTARELITSAQPPLHTVFEDIHRVGGGR